MKIGHLILLVGFAIPCLGEVQAAPALAEPTRVAPPLGIVIPEEDRARLTHATAELAGEITSLQHSLVERPELLSLLPDVQVYHKAVHWALTYQEFYRSNEVAVARGLLQQGLERARQLRAGSPSWVNATGLVVRGFASKIDGSAQPYGLVVPASFALNPKRARRLDVWLHGRDNHLTELKFINDRQKSPGEFTPPDAIVVHPYGRYCNAFKFAGETDVFEAVEAVARHYEIDSGRRAIRGFSMGGAGCWHLATHHPGFWKAAAPGAGFAETAAYTKALAQEPKPQGYEQTLWHLYDATDYALNLFNCPTIAYSGELDKQKQAADIMAHALRAEGLDLTHLIGPGVEHKYEPATKRELARRFDELMAAPRQVPREIRFATWTLRYNQMSWIALDALQQHWSPAQVTADINDDRIGITTSNVTGLTLKLETLRLRCAIPRRIIVDGQSLLPGSSARMGSELKLAKRGSKWVFNEESKATGLRKRHGLQGPIDDAFVSSFLVVRPTGQSQHREVDQWVANQLAHFTNEWRSQFRGEAPVKDDVSVTAHDIAQSNLILWGDPASNSLLAKVLKRLPVSWTKHHLELGGHSVSAKNHVPVFIYPNPLNPERYVVVNSGFTFCEFGNASNARQTPKLPDFALVDVTAPVGRRPHHQSVHAGFFDEEWKWRKAE